MSDQAYFCYITCGSMKEAKEIASAVVSERLAACANIIPGMISAYWWDGAMQHDEEIILITKTTASKFESLKDRVTELHSYDCPCIIGWPIAKGNAPYMNWIAEETSKPAV